MKALILSVALLFIAFISNAQTPDSCYVYTKLHWAPTMTKYVAQIQLNPDCDDMDIVHENGEVLSFKNIYHALNYLSTKGWELVEMSKINPDNNMFTAQQYAIIKKKYPITEAAQYCTPIIGKQKK